MPSTRLQRASAAAVTARSFPKPQPRATDLLRPPPGEGSLRRLCPDTARLQPGPGASFPGPGRVGPGRALPCRCDDSFPQGGCTAAGELGSPSCPQGSPGLPPTGAGQAETPLPTTPAALLQQSALAPVARRRGGPPACPGPGQATPPGAACPDTAQTWGEQEGLGLQEGLRPCTA